MRRKPRAWLLALRRVCAYLEPAVEAPVVAPPDEGAPPLEAVPEEGAAPVALPPDAPVAEPVPVPEEGAVPVVLPADEPAEAPVLLPEGALPLDDEVGAPPAEELLDAEPADDVPVDVEPAVVELPVEPEDF